MLLCKKGPRLCINKSELKPEANNEEVVSKLYLALYNEFFGAKDKPAYKKLNNIDRLCKAEEFAQQWLRERNLL